MVADAMDAILVFNGFNVTINGGVTGLLGPNGAGKSTLMSVMATLDPLDAGEIRVFGMTPADHDQRTEIRRRVGYLPQVLGHQPGMRLLDFVEYAAWLKRVERSELRKRSLEALSQVGLADRSRDRLRTLSGGGLQRAGLAASLVHDPSLALLDEPTSGLDPQQRVVLRSILRARGARGSVVLSTHNVEDISLTCDRVLVIAGGQLVFTGSPRELEAAGHSRKLVKGTGLSGLSALERGFEAVVERQT